MAYPAVMVTFGFWLIKLWLVVSALTILVILTPMLWRLIGIGLEVLSLFG